MTDRARRGQADETASGSRSWSEPATANRPGNSRRTEKLTKWQQRTNKHLTFVQDTSSRTLQGPSVVFPAWTPCCPLSGFGSWLLDGWFCELCKERKQIQGAAPPEGATTDKMNRHQVLHLPLQLCCFSVSPAAGTAAPSHWKGIG